MRTSGRWIAAFLMLAAGAAAPGCRPDGRTTGEGGGTVVQRPIAEVLAAHTPGLMAIPGVTGTYEGVDDNGRSCIKVMVIAASPEIDGRVPRELEGYPVIVEVTGEIRAMPGEGR